MRTTRQRKAVLSACALAMVAASLAGCQGGAPPSPPPSSSPPASEAVPLEEIRSIGAVGDSFTAAANACDTRRDCPEVSWSIGTDPRVMSIASRLEQLTGTRPETVSAALTGGDVQDSLDSAPQIVAAAPDLITVMIGGNDLCGYSVEQMTPVDVFEERFSELLHGLADQLPDARLLVLSLPSFETFWELARVEPRAVEYWARNDVCRSALIEVLSDDPAAAQGRQALLDQAEAFNAIIESTCAELSRCIYDGGALSAHRFTQEELSAIDYAHPSILGHKKIAEIAWTALVEGLE